jgi:hypothetical protein
MTGVTGIQWRILALPVHWYRWIPAQRGDRGVPEGTSEVIVYGDCV